MAFLVSDAVTRIRRIHSAITEDIALEYINVVNHALHLDLPVNVTTETINLVSGTQEYALNENTLRIFRADILTSATNRVPLQEYDYSMLNQTRPGWRSATTGMPGGFYTWRNATDNLVGLLPKPSTTTSGGYPVVALEVSRTPSATLTSGSSLPKSLQSLDLYVYGVVSRYLQENPSKEGLQMSEHYAALYERAKEQERHRLYALNPFQPRQQMGFPIRGNV